MREDDELILPLTEWPWSISTHKQETMARRATQKFWVDALLERGLY